jgi:hypothetical protein
MKIDAKNNVTQITIRSQVACVTVSNTEAEDAAKKKKKKVK